MKKNIFFLFILLTLGLTVAWGAKRVDFKAGMTQSRLLSDGEGHWLTGMALGAAGSFKLAHRLFWQPEILFVRKGDANAFPPVLPGMTSRVSIDYLEIPVLLKWHFLANDKLKLALFGGGYFAFKLSAKSQSQYQEYAWRENLRDEVKKVDLGALLGVGLEKAWGRKRVLLEVRGSHGLINADKLLQDVFNMKNWQNLSLALLLGLGI